MIVGTILLTKNNFYTNAAGELPKRPKFDKELLSGLIKGHRVSDEGYGLLPLSMQKLVTVSEELDMPITIPELAKAELLIVVRSLEELTIGKVFRLDNHKLLVKDRRIELWILNKKQ